MSVEDAQYDELLSRFFVNTTNPEQTELINVVRRASLDYAMLISDITKASREQSLALTALEESLSWTIKAIIKNN